ncbi:MAG: hypothetical protein JSR00_05160 [Bacteroidetes bacterium]|nr:hypothetical protein [Bacteroidota bacterium]
MKKIISALIILLCFSVTAPAQTTPNKDLKTITTVKKKKVVHKKKDGTPDKRYKENKSKKLKKDGTPDMRYKVNKQ